MTVVCRPANKPQRCAPANLVSHPVSQCLSGPWVLDRSAAGSLGSGAVTQLCWQAGHLCDFALSIAYACFDFFQRSGPGESIALPVTASD